MSTQPSINTNILSQAFQKFVQLEGAAGILLIFSLMFALIIANSSLYPLYDAFINLHGIVQIGNIRIEKPALLWINDGWMAIFFMILTLEIKREMIDGELANFRMVTLPLSAAIGGIAIPALIYLLINLGGDPLTHKGWPIPTTTDVAFVLGVVAIFRKYIPNSLKVFVVALSIVDDILAITIIAIFYTADLSITSLALGGFGVLVLIILNRCRVMSLIPYAVTGLLIWVCVLKSGVHATLAGVLVGFFIPYKDPHSDYSPLKYLEHSLHPWVAYFILPAFVFVNGGISFEDFAFSQLLIDVPLGISMGLFLGKSIGVFGFSWFVIKTGFCKMPSNSNWLQLLATSTLTGIGFTMSLFLSSLAFFDTPYEDLARKGIILGSLLSGVVAIFLYWLADKLKKEAL